MRLYRVVDVYDLFNPGVKQGAYQPSLHRVRTGEMQSFLCSDQLLVRPDWNGIVGRINVLCICLRDIH